MSTYELNDDDVRAMLDRTEYGGPELAKVVQALQKQLPLLVPTKLGAVVRSETAGVVVLCEPDGDTQWRTADGMWYHSAELGRIEKVISEGVEL